MPTYEYACKECGEHLEVQQSFTDSALTECPACHGALRKVFGNIAITFKGSGFYKTDSRSSTAKEGATKSGDAAAKSGDTPASSTTESAKPAEKTAAPEKSTPKPAMEKAAS